MSTDLSVVTILGVKAKVLELRVRTADAPETNGYSATRSFALLLIEEAWTRAADEGFKAPKKPRPIELEFAKRKYSEWITEAFMKKHVKDYITRTEITARVNVCDRSREQEHELLAIRDRTELMGSTKKREAELEKSHHYIELKVTVTDAKWLEGLKAGLIFGSTAYDVWGDDPLAPKEPKGTPWAWAPKGKKTKQAKKPAPARGGVQPIDAAFDTALDERKAATAIARVKKGHVDVDARYIVERRELSENYETSKDTRRESTALLQAAEKHQARVVAALIELGADPKATDEHGDTALMLCATFEIFELLVEAGADLHATNHLGQNVLHRIAREESDDDWRQMARLAFERGVDGTKKDKHGKTPLDLAKATAGVTFDLLDPPTLEKRLTQVSNNLLGGETVPPLLAAWWQEHVKTGKSALFALGEAQVAAFPEAFQLSHLAQNVPKKLMNKLHWVVRGNASTIYALYRTDKKAGLDRTGVVMLDHNGDFRAYGRSLEEFFALRAEETNTTTAARKWFASKKLAWPDLESAKEARRTQPTPSWC